LRQCGHRYAIRAGRNLPDKEFRYLRTVIVTAAVYRGFDQELRFSKERLTPSINLPAPGRRHTLYFHFRVAVKWWLRLFIKNIALCEHESGSIGCDACPVPEG